MQHDTTPQPATDGAAASSTRWIYDLDGGALCLDFANTLSSTSGEHLRGYADFVDFAYQSHLITPAEADRLQALAERQGDAGTRVLERAKRVRRALYLIFSAVAAGTEPPAAELEVFNRELGLALRHARLEQADDGGFGWTWDDDGLEWILWPMLRSAAEVLTSDTQRPLVRECGSGECRWLFLDTTRNRSRQWCSMQSCGNREKARRHYQRLKERRSA